MLVLNHFCSFKYLDFQECDNLNKVNVSIIFYSLNYNFNMTLNYVFKSINLIFAVLTILTSRNMIIKINL